jgi:hypothetical protein
MARRPPRWFSTWSAYNRYRIDRGAEIGLSKGQALGHPRRGELKPGEVERTYSLITAAGPREITTRGTKEARLAGRRARDQRELAAGRLDGAEFAKRWRGKTIGGQPMEANPERVIERIRRDREAADLRYRRGATRRAA